MEFKHSHKTLEMFRLDKLKIYIIMIINHFASIGTLADVVDLKRIIFGPFLR